jgi:hypothetical protein
LYLEARLWPDGATCPSCILRDRITTRKGGYYRFARGLRRANNWLTAFGPLKP